MSGKGFKATAPARYSPGDLLRSEGPNAIGHELDAIARRAALRTGYAKQDYEFLIELVRHYQMALASTKPVLAAVKTIIGMAAAHAEDCGADSREARQFARAMDAISEAKTDDSSVPAPGLPS